MGCGTGRAVRPTNGESVARKQPFALCDQRDGVPPSALAITGEHLLGFLAVAAECHDEGVRFWSSPGDHDVTWERSQLRHVLTTVRSRILLSSTIPIPGFEDVKHRQTWSEVVEGSWWRSR
jgi:hypothetical protein